MFGALRLHEMNSYLSEEKLHFLRLGIGFSEGVHGNRFHHLIIERSVAVIGGSFRDFVHDIHPFDYLAEGGIAAVKMRRILMHDEEL